MERGGGHFAVSESRPGYSIERFDRSLSREYIESSKSREIERLCRPPVSVRETLFDFFERNF